MVDERQDYFVGKGIRAEAEIFLQSGRVLIKGGNLTMAALMRDELKKLDEYAKGYMEDHPSTADATSRTSVYLGLLEKELAKAGRIT